MSLHQPFRAMAQGEVDYTVEVVAIANRKETPMTICAQEGAIYITKAQAMAFFGLVDPVEAEKATRLKVVKDLRSSAFLHCDVNKEDVLLCIKHGCTLIEAKKLEEAEIKRGAKLVSTMGQILRAVS